MKRFRRIYGFMMSVMILSTALVWTNSTKAFAETCGWCGGSGRIYCTSCSGVGTKQVTMTRTVTTYIGGVPFTQYYPYTSYSICSSCGGSGSKKCGACGGTGKVGSSSSTSSKVKYGTVLAATDGIGNYEDAPNLLDGDKSTKLNVKATKAYIIWKAPTMMSVSSYTITTANDTATYTGRNPKSWVLYGSNKKLSRNSSGWKKIAAVTNDTKLKAVNLTSFTYKLNAAAKPYQYYKLEITKNAGADCTQLSEFTLKGTSVTVKKTALSSVKKSGTKMSVKWKKVSGATGYQVQYSTSSDFKSSKTITVKGVSKVSTTIKSLNSKKGYCVRVRAYKTVNSGTVYSSWSAKKKVS